MGSRCYQFLLTHDDDVKKLFLKNRNFKASKCLEVAVPLIMFFLISLFFKRYQNNCDGE